MYDFAYGLIQTAGAKLKIIKMHSKIEMKEKSSQMDIVTNHDVFIEKYLTESILEKYPEHLILAEECYHEKNIAINTYAWIIDPIDGTMNYYRFAKDYAISLAVYYGQEAIFRLVYDVVNECMYCARTGGVPFINGIRLHNQSENDGTLKNAVVGMSLRTMKELDEMGTNVLNFLSKAQAHRYLGCASLELCKVASGEYDLFISSNVYLWDIAAARILIEQSGGFLIACEKNKNSVCSEKLYVAAFRSKELWIEALGHFTENVQNAFGILRNDPATTQIVVKNR